MAILAECPLCHRKMSNRHKQCSCGANMDKAKSSGRVRYWISYYLPGNKKRTEYISKSIEEARDAESKRRVQKREGKLLNIDRKMTFAEQKA